MFKLFYTLLVIEYVVEDQMHQPPSFAANKLAMNTWAMVCLMMYDVLPTHMAAMVLQTHTFQVVLLNRCHAHERQD